MPIDEVGDHQRRRSTVGVECPACHEKFKEGDSSTLVVLGPGPSKEAQQRCRDGRVYNAVAIEVHWTCATGYP